MEKLSTISSFDLGRIKYSEAYHLQKMYFDTLIDHKLAGVQGNECILLCEHNPVFTIGKSGKENNMLLTAERLEELGLEYFHIDRGGDVTYHGPGQITAYFILDLEKHRLGLKQFVHQLEEVVIRFLKRYGVNGERMNGATGVWIDKDFLGKQRKICAIGIRSSRFVTMHGIGLNINTDLEMFGLINPCGFTDKGVTSLAKELGYEVSIEEAKSNLSKCINDVFFPVG
ncbi:MAG: lipoyl(octanoyl) transferase LipB [Tannerellaceae bacterium]